MEGHDQLERLRREVMGDLAPVRPLRAPGVRALWLCPVAVLLAAVVLAAFGLRQDIERVGVWTAAAFSLAQVSACVVLLWVALRFAVPAMGGSIAAAFLWVPGAAIVHVVINWATLGRSELSPPAGRDWSTGLACLGAVTVLSLAPLVLGAVLVLRGWLGHVLPAFVLAGVAGGLAAEATWRLHCAYSNWGHILPFHSATVALPVLIAMGLAGQVRRRFQ